MNDRERLLNVEGHATLAYGQQSYDGDFCKQCGWQGPTNSGKNHTEETRRELFDELLRQHDEGVWDDGYLTGEEYGHALAKDTIGVQYSPANPYQTTEKEVTK